MSPFLRTGTAAVWQGLALALVCISLIATPAEAAVKIGKTTLVVSKVTGSIEQNLRVLARKDDIHQDEIIEAAEASASEIVFADKTRISIGPNTKLTLDRFVYDPDRGEGVMEMTLVQGVFRFVSGGISETPKASYIVHTPTATIGIRGTIVSTVIGDDGQMATVLETDSVVTIVNEEGVIKTLDTAGTAVTASADGVLSDPGLPPVWALKRIAELRALLAGAPTDTAGPADPSPPGPPTAEPNPPADEPPAAGPPADPTGRGLTRAASVASDQAQSDPSKGLGKATGRGDDNAEGNSSHGQGAGNSGNGPGGAGAAGGGSGPGGNGAGGNGNGPGGNGNGNGNGPGGNGNGPGGNGNGNGPGGNGNGPGGSGAGGGAGGGSGGGGG